MHHVHHLHHHLYLPPPAQQVPSIPLPPLSPTTPTDPPAPAPVYALPTAPPLPHTARVNINNNNDNNNGGAIIIPSGGIGGSSSSTGAGVSSSALSLSLSPVLIAPRLLPATAPLHVLASVSASARVASSSPTPIRRATNTSSIEIKAKKALAKRTFACGLCSSTFTERFNLNKHVRAVHERRRPFQCPTCSQRFQQRDHMQKHEACVHKKLRLFACTACGAAFGWRGVLKKHKRSSACVPNKKNILTSTTARSPPSRNINIAQDINAREVTITPSSAAIAPRIPTTTTQHQKQQQHISHPAPTNTAQFTA